MIQFVEFAPDCYPRDNLCAEELTPWHNGSWEKSFKLNCEDNGVLEIQPGVFSNGSVLEFPVTGKYLVEVDNSFEHQKEIAVVKCKCQADVILIKGGSQEIFEFEAGKYRIIAGRYAEDVSGSVDAVNVTIVH